MVTKEQAQSAFYRREFHYGDCLTRGKVDRWRVNGQCTVWKTRPTDFRLPIKYGLYHYGYIDQDNAADFHLASECPISTQ